MVYDNLRRAGPVQEKAFGRIAVERGFITKKQLDEVLVIMKKLEELGMRERMGAVMVKKGYMSEEQVRQVVTQQGRDKRSVIPGYEIVEKLGQGAFGAVYKARQLSLDRPVAIKILPPSLAKNEGFIARFMREARAVAKLSHPNIVQGIDVNRAAGYYYFVMEYIDGETVTEFLKREGRLEERQALNIAKQIAAALSHADKHGMVHRDVKPDNIMVARDGTAKLCDLGLAKSSAGGELLTRPGGTVGTPHYISPEQARGVPDIDVRSDIYSLGATLYHMLTGRTPYEGESAAVVMTKHLAEEIPSPQEIVEDLSEGVCHIIEKCMAKDREDRYQKPDEFISDVQRVLRKEAPFSPRLAAGKSSITRAAKRAELRRKLSKETGPAAAAGRLGAGVWVVVAVCLFLICGIVASFLWPAEEKDQEKPRRRVRSPAGVSFERPAPGRKDKGEALLAEALEYAGANPKDYSGIFSRLKEVVDRTSGVVKLKAGDELRAWKARRDEELNKAVDAAKKKAEGLAGELRFAEAIRAFDSVPRNLAKGTDLVRRERKKFRKLARRRLAELSAEARKKCDAGDFSGARKLADGLKDFGLPEAEAERAKLTRTIDLAAKKARERLAREKAEKAREEHASIVARAMELARVRDFAGAVKACEEALGKKELSRWRDEFKRLKSDFSACFELESAALRGLEDAVRTRRSVYVHRGKDEFKVKVAEVSGRDLYIEKGGATLKLSFDDLTPYDILRLAEPSDRYGYALLLYFGGEAARARDQFENAAKDPKLKPACDYHLRKIAGAEAEAREEEATELLSRAREEYKSDDIKSLARTLAKLDSYRDTAVYGENYAPPAPSVPGPVRKEKLPMRAEPHWQISDGRWSFSGDELAGSSLEGALMKNWDWEEYVFEGQWLAEEGTKEVIFIARAISNRWKDNAVCVAVGPSSAEVRRYRGRPVSLVKEAVDVPNGKWRRFRLDVRGGMVGFYMDGKTVVRARWLPGPRGALGFAVEGRARFKDLVVHVLRERSRPRGRR